MTEQQLQQGNEILSQIEGYKNVRRKIINAMDSIADYPNWCYIGRNIDNQLRFSDAPDTGFFEEIKSRFYDALVSLDNLAVNRIAELRDKFENL